ncbi:zinc finger CCCH domain-containing protein 3-like isoform X2 [Myotis lucifugus]|uniref:zinc finger CCCH domain-containing protein 3-like isoform X2 n=1 Tax=Myotis lucifugus TaxID=59463 RepID=UPI000CCC5DCA|nr:zinc finger CCCH domain-containing protein 3-like isoform X2 [Myotis lucifugus]
MRLCTPCLCPHPSSAGGSWPAEGRTQTGWGQGWVTLLCSPPARLGSWDPPAVAGSLQACLPGDKKSSPPPTATAKSQFSLRRRQALRGRSGPVQKKSPPKGLMQVTRHRLCCLPPGRTHLPVKEASNLNALPAPATSKVIKTRYRIVKKNPVSPFSASPFPLSLPSWRARRLSLSRLSSPLGNRLLRL